MNQVRGESREKRVRSGGRRYYDYNLLAIVILLTCFGLIMLYSASAYRAQITEKAARDMEYFGKQAKICAVCLAGVLIASQIDYHFYAKFAGIAYLVANFLIIITKFIGRSANGATRWIYVGGVSFQAAEFGKVAIILLLPVVIVKMGKKIKGFKAPALVLLLGAVTSVCTLYFTSNLSTAIIIAGITIVLLGVTHPRAKRFVILGGGAIVAAVYAVRRFAESEWFAHFVGSLESGGSLQNRLNRLLVWVDPETYSAAGGYQVMQGLYAIGSGGFFGKGLGNSIQKLSAVPEAQNDMIFAIICEELGVFGAAMLTLMFIFMLYRLMFIAQNAPDLLGSLIVTGIFAHIALQVVLNIAVVLNLIPTTGITLPFVSYGGTSIVFLMVEMALALSVSKQIKFQTAENMSGQPAQNPQRRLRPEHRKAQ
ncbi:FtsW/RodA/SpoVE family cell cycle protein [Lachnospiraceae bacterium 46-15]